jgi:hypothetical protein
MRSLMSCLGHMRRARPHLSNDTCLFLKLFYVEQFWVNGKGLAKFVGSGLFCSSCICVELWCFVPCYSEWGFWAVERRIARCGEADLLTGMTDRKARVKTKGWLTFVELHLCRNNVERMSRNWTGRGRMGARNRCSGSRCSRACEG